MNTLAAVLFVPHLVSSSGGGSWGIFDTLMLVGATFLTVAIMREMDRESAWPQKPRERNRIDIALWIAACICPLTWVILFGAGLYHLAKRHDSP